MTNTAFRILHVLDTVAEFEAPANNAAIQVWEVILKQLLNTERISSNLVAAHILNVHDQVELLGEQLAEAKVPADLYKQYLKAISDQLMPTKIAGTNWQTYRAKITDTHLHIVHWAALILDVQEDAIEAADMTRLREQAEQLWALSQIPDIPLALKKLLVRLAEDLDNAIIDYPIRGVAPLQAALKAGIGDVASQLDIINTLEKSEVAEKRALIPKLLKTLKTTAETVDQVAKTGGSITTIFKLGGDAFKALTQT